MDMPIDTLAGRDAECLRLARSHYENFPVLVPFLGRARRELATIYAFCRTTDDLGDEVPGDRRNALDRWEGLVRMSLEGTPPREHPPLVALSIVARRHALPQDLFLRLIEANRRDQSVHRYPDEAALLDYCHHSATPVGRMVLGVLEAGRGHEELADATCIGLQLANFWQDLARDWAQGRCYLPLDRCRAFGVDLDVELEKRRAAPALRALVAERVAGAREWLLRGWPLADHLPTRWRPLVRGFTRGGWAILDAIEEQDHDTLRTRPSLPGGARARIILGELLRAHRCGVQVGARR